MLCSWTNLWSMLQPIRKSTMVHWQCTMVHRQCTMVLFLIGTLTCDTPLMILYYWLVEIYVIFIEKNEGNKSWDKQCYTKTSKVCNGYVRRFVLLWGSRRCRRWRHPWVELQFFSCSYNVTLYSGNIRFLFHHL